MKSIVLEQPGVLSLQETAVPPLSSPEEALVRVHHVGICGTDLHAYRGRQPLFTYPRIPGHELGVEVVALGSAVCGLRVGDRCAVEPYLNCGRCIACRRNRPNCCIHLQVMGVHVDGGLRQYLACPARKLHRSDTLSLEQLALVETLGIGAHAVARSALQPGESVLVIGAGPIGVSVIQFAQIEAARVIVLDVNPDRLRFCREQLGVELLLDNADDALGQLEELTGGDLPTAVLDATGNPHSMMQAFRYVAHGGRLVFVGLFQGDVAFHDPDFHRRELTLMGSRNAVAADFRRIIALLEEGKLDAGPWITHRAPFEQVVEEFPRWLQPEAKVLKAVVQL